MMRETTGSGWPGKHGETTTSSQKWPGVYNTLASQGERKLRMRENKSEEKMEIMNLKKRKKSN